MTDARPEDGRREAAARAGSSVFRRTAGASVVAALGLALVAGWVAHRDRLHREALFLHEGGSAVALEREFLTRELQAVHSDLTFLAREPLFERVLAGDASAAPALEERFAAFARSKPLYDQVRLLDGSGREAVRVNRHGDRVEIVGDDALQAKGGRYYFRDAIGLPAGGVFVSPLDLNVERGEIERPLKPVIRLATPVESATGSARGLLVLNYVGARLLAKLREIAAASPGDLMLVNRDGEYIQAPDPGREWGWLLGHAASFREDHPAAWERIRAADRTQARIGEDVFSAEWVPLAEGGAAARNALAIVSRIPLFEPAGPATGPPRLALALGVLAAVVILSYAWARASVARRGQERRIAESEARLRTLSSRLLAAQEDERRSLSRLLHDELGQRITAVALDLKSALRRPVDASTEHSLRRAVEEIDGTLASLHEVAKRVRPSVLDDLGLREAVESYVAEYQARTGVRVDLELDLPAASAAGLSRPVAENVYRIVQEGLANVAAHAGSEEARIELVANGDRLELVIEDEGKGFDATALKSTSRLGILGMRERVELLGGEFGLETAPGRGARVHVRLPLGAQRDDGPAAGEER